MPTNRSYEILTEIESAGTPTLAPLPVGDAESTQDALSLDGLEALGFPANSIHGLVANIAALKAIDAAVLTTTLIDGTLCQVNSNTQIYRYHSSSSEVDNGYTVLTPDNNAGARWIVDRARPWVNSETSTTLTALHEVVLLDTSAGDQTYTLPQASGMEGKTITLVKNTSDTYKATINTYAGEFVQKGGAFTVSFTIRYNSESYTLMCNGVVWLIVAHYRDPQIGDGSTDGDWRMYKSGTSLFMQRRESGVWVDKHEFEA